MTARKGGWSKIRRGILGAALCIALLGANLGGILSAEAATDLLPGVVTGADGGQNLPQETGVPVSTEKPAQTPAPEPEQKDGESASKAPAETTPSDGGNPDAAGDGTEQTPGIPEETKPADPPKAEACIHHAEHDEACGYTEENPVCAFVCAICPVQKQVDAILAQMEQAGDLDDAATEKFNAQALAAYAAYQALKPEDQAQISGADTLALLVEALQAQLLALEDATMEIEAAVIKDDSGVEQDLRSKDTFDIDYTKQVTLHIKIKSTLNLKDKKVEIKIPDGLVVVEYPKPNTMTGLVAGVTPENLDDLKGGDSYGAYQPKSGTITYSLRDTAENTSFNIILAPDTTLWNKQLNTALKEPLVIRTYSGAIGDAAGQTEYQKVSSTAKIVGDVLKSGPVFTSWDKKWVVPEKAGVPFKMQQVRFRSDRNRYTMGMFFRELRITIALPYDATKDTYAVYDHMSYDIEAGDGINWLNPEQHKDVDGFSFVEETDDVNHTVILTWKNLYLPRDEYFTPYFRWENEDDCAPDDTIKWRNSTIVVSDPANPTSTPTGGAAVSGEMLYWDDAPDAAAHPIGNTNFNKADLDKYKAMAEMGAMQIKGKSNANSIYNSYDVNPGIIYYLGQFHVTNGGTAATAPQTVEFAYAYNDKIGVVAQRIPASDGNEVTVWYTTNVKTDEVQYGQKLLSKGGSALFNAEMAGLGAGEYFTAIRAEVGSYDAEYISYATSRDMDPSSGHATTYGKLLTNEGDATPKGTQYPAFATMKLYETASGATGAQTATYNVGVTKQQGTAVLGMFNALDDGGDKIPVLDVFSTTAGQEVHFNGVIATSAYPYSVHQVLLDAEIYIRLPKAVEVEDLRLMMNRGSTADRILLGDSAIETGTITHTELVEGADYTITTSAEDAQGYVLRKITFKGESGMIGWFTESLGQRQLALSFTMKIAANADAMALDMRDCVRVKSATLESQSQGTLGEFQYPDTNDLNADGNTTQFFSSFSVNATDTKLSVVAARLGLTFGFGAKLSDPSAPAEGDDEGYYNFEGDGQIVFLKESDHGIDLRFTGKNETGKTFSKEDARAFYYYIPVPKKGDNWDSHIQYEAFDFDMKMTGPATVTGGTQSDLHVQYSTTVDSTKGVGEEGHYNDKSAYVDASGIDDWSQVKMLRISVKDTVEEIPVNADVKVYIHYETAQPTSELVGSTVNFGPCGYTPYTVGNEENGGHMPLPHIQAEFQTGIIGGKVFLDKNFNGAYDADVDELYLGDVKIEAPNQGAVGGDDQADYELTAKNGSYEFAGLRADTYHVTVTNPGTPTASSAKPLKFSLPASGGKFMENEGGSAATATIVVNSDNSKANLALNIGLQEPHTVSFTAANATLGHQTASVWHSEAVGEASIPTVTPQSGWAFTGKWTDGAGKVLTAKELADRVIEGDGQTFAAQVVKLYTVTYDGNDNTEGTVPTAQEYKAGDQFSIAHSEGMKKGDAIFAGWSAKEKITDILTADADAATINKIITDDEYTMPAEDLTFYAVWAVDANGNGNPDYADDAVHVRYHSNNGERIDVICPHHHVVGATAQLSTTAEEIYGRKADHGGAGDAGTIGTYSFKKDKAVFLGWSTNAFPDIIATQADYDNLKASIFTQVEMKAQDNDVYAVWAEDRNGNGVADYTEQVKVVYNGNALQGGSATKVPSDNDSHIPGDKVTLSTSGPDHSDVDGKKVLFLGWTKQATAQIYCRADEAPVTIKEIELGSEDKTVYAAWGYDEDGGGTADVLETYTLTYDLLGGRGSAPADKTDLKKGEHVALTTEKNFERNAQEVFVGWSRTKKESAYTSAEGSDVEKALITGTEIIVGTENVTLYAVWAEDRNGNDIADYTECIKVVYDGNPQQGGTASKAPSDSGDHVSGDKVTLSTSGPDHSDVGGKRVLFLGWTEQATQQIYRRADEEPKTVAEIVMGGEDKTVYAAWGYDEDGDGAADVLETYSLTYDLNGGRGTAPAGKTDLKKGERVALTTEKNFERNAQEVFVGWSRTKQESAFTSAQAGDALKILIADAEIVVGTEDVSLYAVWAVDEDGDGQPDYQREYSVTYDLNDGTPAENETYDPEMVMTGQVHTAKAAPSRSGYTFAGWKDADGGVHQPGEAIVVIGDLTLTAQWRSKSNPDISYPDYTEPGGPSNTPGEGRPSWTERPTQTNRPIINIDHAPQTGDETNLMLWLVILGVSCAGVIATLLISKQRSKRAKRGKK